VSLSSRCHSGRAGPPGQNPSSPSSRPIARGPEPAEAPPRHRGIPAQGHRGGPDPQVAPSWGWSRPSPGHGLLPNLQNRRPKGLAAEASSIDTSAALDCALRLPALLRNGRQHARGRTASWSASQPAAERDAVFIALGGEEPHHSGGSRGGRVMGRRKPGASWSSELVGAPRRPRLNFARQVARCHRAQNRRLEWPAQRAGFDDLLGGDPAEGGRVMLRGGCHAGLAVVSRAAMRSNTRSVFNSSPRLQASRGGVSARCRAHRNDRSRHPPQFQDCSSGDHPVGSPQAQHEAGRG